MSQFISFLAGLAITTAVVFVALLYLRRPLQAILTDICGTPDRARFWSAFSNITLFLVPFVLALNHRPTADGSQPIVFAITDQIESAITGLIVSIMMLGIVLSWHISRFNNLSRTAKESAREISSQTETTTI
jgi:hypothetical protein